MTEQLDNPIPDEITEHEAPPLRDRGGFPWVVMLAAGAIVFAAWSPSLPWLEALPAVTSPPERAWALLAELPADLRSLRAGDDELWAVGAFGAAFRADASDPSAWRREPIVIPEDAIPPGASEPDMPPSPVVEDLNAIAITPGGVYLVGGLEDSADSSLFWRPQGSRRWLRPAPLDGGYLTDVAIDGRRAVAVGTLGLVVSRDAGQTWSTLVPTPGPLTSVAIGPEGAALAVGTGGLLLRTEDGERWAAKVVDSDAGTLTSVALADGATGWITTDAGLLLESRDGGRTWSSVEGPLGTRGTTPLLVLARGSAQQSIAAAGGARGAVLLTVDGRTWFRHDVPGAVEVVGLAFVGSRLLAATAAGRIYATQL